MEKAVARLAAARQLHEPEAPFVAAVLSRYRELLDQRLIAQQSEAVGDRPSRASARLPLRRG